MPLAGLTHPQSAHLVWENHRYRIGMGNGVSRFAGSGTLKRLVNSANLPLDVDDDISHDQLQDPGKVFPRSAQHMGVVRLGHPASHDSLHL